jgi:hypothetical protein
VPVFNQDPRHEYEWGLLTSALYEVNDQLQAPTALPHGDILRCPLYKKLGGLQGRSGRCRQEINILLLLEVEHRPSVIQPVAE